MNKAIKYRIYPTKEQEIMFAKTFGCCRKVYNLMLEDKIKHYKATKETLNNTPAQYKAEYEYLKEIDSLALANEQMHLKQAFKNFFSNPKHFGYPKFKAKKSSASYSTNKVGNNLALEGSFIKLPKVGYVKAKIHRLPSETWKLKAATISKTSSGKYYASLLFEFEEAVETSTLTKAIGLDYASNGLYVDSEGNAADMPHFYRKNEKKLAREQRRLSRKTKGGSNYNKQKLKVAKIHEHTANQRKDFLHKKSREITNLYDVVCVENLNMKAMSRSLRLGKSTMDNGYGMFLNFLGYKLADEGKILVRVDKFFPSSQMCSECGTLEPGTKDLSIRQWTCSCCGTHHDRDINAAINIKNEGLRMLNVA